MKKGSQIRTSDVVRFIGMRRIDELCEVVWGRELS